MQFFKSLAILFIASPVVRALPVIADVIINPEPAKKEVVVKETQRPSMDSLYARQFELEQEQVSIMASTLLALRGGDYSARAQGKEDSRLVRVELDRVNRMIQQRNNELGTIKAEPVIQPYDFATPHGRCHREFKRTTKSVLLDACREFQDKNADKFIKGSH